MRLLVQATNAAGSSQALSAPTQVISAAASKPQSTSPPTVSGSLGVGSVLTVHPGGWSGTQPISFSYQWLRCNADGGGCQAIGGAASQTYRISSSDSGHRLVVVVSATNAAGTTQATATAGTVGATGKPTVVSAPSVSGTLRVGATLTVNVGSWSGAQPISFAYQWLRCDANGGNCRAIGGANKQRYKVASADLGHRLVVLVTARNRVGTTRVTTTAGNVGNTNAPAVKTAPSITGSPQVGQTLQLKTGVWTTPTPLTAVYQRWLRCDGNGNGCAAIGGATGRSYAVSAADAAHRLRAQVTAVNKYGSTIATTAPTGVVGGTPTAPGAVPVQDVSLPQRLTIDKVSFNPSRIHSRSQLLTLRVHVRDSRGHGVSGALVFARGVPANRVSASPERTTGADGWATFSFRPLARLPMRNGSTLVMFVRARKPGGSLLGGISTRRLVQVRVEPR